jgi:hypothetical protein
MALMIYPKTDSAIRETIETRAKANGWPAMHEELRKSILLQPRV